MDSGGLGGAIGGAGAILDDGDDHRTAAMIIAGAAEVMGGGDVRVVPGDVMRAGIELEDEPGHPGHPGVVGDPAADGDGDGDGDPANATGRVPGSISGGGASSVLGKRDADDEARKDGDPHRALGPSAKRSARGVSPPPPPG